MATINDESNVSSASSISGEALEELDVFVSGLDDVVYEIAQELAKRRSKELDSEGQIMIEVEDIRRAANLVIERIRNGIASGELPSELAPMINQIEERRSKRTK